MTMLGMYEWDHFKIRADFEELKVLYDDDKLVVRRVDKLVTQS